MKRCEEPLRKWAVPVGGRGRVGGRGQVGGRLLSGAASKHQRDEINQHAAIPTPPLVTSSLSSARRPVSAPFSSLFNGAFSGGGLFYDTILGPFQVKRLGNVVKRKTPAGFLTPPVSLIICQTQIFDLCISSFLFLHLFCFVFFSFMFLQN